MDGLTNGALEYMARQMRRKDVQQRIRTEVVAPLITLLYHELYPYIIVSGTAIMLILVVVLFLLVKLR